MPHDSLDFETGDLYCKGDPIVAQTPQDAIRKVGWITGKLFERRDDGEIRGCCLVGSLYISVEGRRLIKESADLPGIAHHPLIRSALDRRRCKSVVDFNDYECPSQDAAIAFLDEILPPSEPVIP